MELPYTSKLLRPGDDLADAFCVRIAVFVDEQGFDRNLETDDNDPIAHHIVLYDGSRPVATGRLFPHAETPGTYVLGRIAVLSECRGGAGRQVMQLLEKQAAALGATTVTLGAQCRVQGFYEKLGYRTYGEMYYDEFCPHINMKKALV